MPDVTVAFDSVRTFAIWVTVPGIILFFQTSLRCFLCSVFVAYLYQHGTKLGLSLLDPEMSAVVKQFLPGGD